MSQTLMLQAARTARATLTKTDAALSDAIAELERPDLDIERLYQTLTETSARNEAQTATLSTLCHLFIASMNGIVAANDKSARMGGDNVVKLRGGRQ